MTVRSIVIGVDCFVVFIDNLCNYRVNGLDLQVLHESAVLEHSASAFEVTTFDENNVAADAAGWLG